MVIKEDSSGCRKCSGPERGSDGALAAGFIIVGANGVVLPT
jgi:hypothetical protein